MQTHLSIVPFLLTLVLSTCEESLPPRNPPQDYLDVTFTASSSAVEIRDSTVTGLGGAMVVGVKNIYVEVLQDSEYARADLDVWMRDQPEQRTHVVATRRELTNSGLIVRGLLTLRPNETATFLKQWSHRTTSGRWFWEFVRLTPKITQTGQRYLESDTVHLIAEGKVQLFKATAPERLPRIGFSTFYRIYE